MNNLIHVLPNIKYLVPIVNLYTYKLASALDWWTES